MQSNPPGFPDLDESNRRELVRLIEYVNTTFQRVFERLSDIERKLETVAATVENRPKVLSLDLSSEEPLETNPKKKRKGARNVQVRSLKTKSS